MKILITAGGTSEKIDEVRKITNTASGQLGALIAEEFNARAGAEITYVCGACAITPGCACAETVIIDSAGRLKETMTELLNRNKFDAVIHTMAVSDYTVRGVVPAEDLALRVAEEICQKGISPADRESLAETISCALLHACGDSGSPKKISSDYENPILFLKKTSKVIKIIKQIQPETILVGFKLLADVDESELLRVAGSLLERNGCDFVLANDVKNITGDRHEGILIGADSSMLRLGSKREIAEAVTENVLAKLRCAQ